MSSAVPQTHTQRRDVYTYVLQKEVYVWHNVCRQTGFYQRRAKTRSVHVRLRAPPRSPDTIKVSMEHSG